MLVSCVFVLLCMCVHAYMYSTAAVTVSIVYTIQVDTGFSSHDERLSDIFEILQNEDSGQ